MRKIGLFLRERRELLGLKQKHVAQKTGISSAYMNKVEKGETTPTPAFLEKIAVPLELDFVDLFLQSLEERSYPESLLIEMREFRKLRPMLLEGMPLERLWAFIKGLSEKDTSRIVTIVEMISLMLKETEDNDLKILANE